MIDIQEINNLHRDAMERIDLALVARRRHDADQALIHFREAYNLESRAAMGLVQLGQAEPARSVLLRSAGALALNCNLLPESEKLICTALAGDPPFEIAEELRDLLEQVHFQRHLELRGITLGEDEVQMSLAGKGVGFGVAPTAAFIDRVEKTETLLSRTAERQQNKPYRDRGRREKSVTDNFESFMTAPRAASFAVTFRVGKSEQPSLPGLSLGEKVIDELLTCLDLFSRADEAGLREHIPQDDYYRNFVALAQGIAPDGREISQVGFTILREGTIKQVALITGARRLPLPPPIPLMDQLDAKRAREPITVSGSLRFADAIKEGHDVIQLVETTKGQSRKGRPVVHKIIVLPGMMSDIVKPLWDTPVVVTGVRTGKYISLQEIRVRDADEVAQ